jgi:hypothetical protein
MDPQKTVDHRVICEMAIIALGNSAVIEAVKTDETTDAIERVARPDLGQQVTTFNVPDNVGIGEALQTVAKVFASHHSDEPPAWVESDDEDFASALSKQFNCPIGRPNDWEETAKLSLGSTEPVTDTQTITQEAAV